MQRTERFCSRLLHALVTRLDNLFAMAFNNSSIVSSWDTVSDASYAFVWFIVQFKEILTDSNK